MTQHSTHPRRPRNADELLIQAVAGLERIAFAKANQETHTLNIEPPHAALLRAAAAQSAPFRVIAKPISTSTVEAA